MHVNRHIHNPGIGLLSVFIACLLAAGLPCRAQDAAGTAPVTLVKPAGATLPPADDGFLRRWLVLEPIPVSGQLTDQAVKDTIGTDYFPAQLSVVPVDGAQVQVGGATRSWHALDTLNYNFNLYHFARDLGLPTSNVLFWVVTVVEAPHDMPAVRLAIGSNAASIWWVNGVQVIDIYNDRQSVIDDGVSRRLELRKGRNLIRAAVINAGGATDFAARFLDRDYHPVTALVQRIE